jgi:DNA-binding beta-propeller fold protein YncE
MISINLLKRENVRGVALLSVLSLLVFLHPANLVAQERHSIPSDIPAVSWYATVNSATLGKSSNLLQKIETVILGNQQASLLRPVTVFATDTANIWISDQGHGRIIHVQHGKRNEFIERKENPWTSLIGITGSAKGKILFSDSEENALYISDGDNHTALFSSSINLVKPTGIAYSVSSGEIWVTETGKHRITLFDGNGKIIRSTGTRGTGNGEFNFPTAIWIDSSGKAFIVDAMNFRIQIFDHDGNHILSFGEQGDASGYFARPKGIATDSRGNIWVSDALFNNIQVFDPLGNLLHYFGSRGTGRGEFRMPSGLFIDSNDFLYIADSYNARIEIYKIDYPQ